MGIKIIVAPNVRRGDTLQLGQGMVHVYDVAVGKSIVAIQVTDGRPEGGQRVDIRTFPADHEFVLVNRPEPVDTEPPAGEPPLTFTRV